MSDLQNSNSENLSDVELQNLNDGELFGFLYKEYLKKAFKEKQLQNTSSKLLDITIAEEILDKMDALNVSDV
jgi:hypothetical protein